MSKVTFSFAIVFVFINLPYGFCEEQSGADWNARGVEAFKSGNYAEARSHFDNAYEAEKNPLYLLNAAKSLARQGRYHAAVQYCKTALGVHPDPELKNKIESLLSHSEQVIKEDLTKRTKQIINQRNWEDYVAEQEAIEREKANRKGPGTKFYWQDPLGSKTDVSRPAGRTDSDYIYEDGPYPYGYRRHRRHKGHERHKVEHHERQKDPRHEQHKDGHSKQSSGSHSSGKTRHR